MARAEEQTLQSARQNDYTRSRPTSARMRDRGAETGLGVIFAEVGGEPGSDQANRYLCGLFSKHVRQGPSYHRRCHDVDFSSRSIWHIAFSSPQRGVHSDIELSLSQHNILEGPSGPRTRQLIVSVSNNHVGMHADIAWGGDARHVIARGRASAPRLSGLGRDVTVQYHSNLFWNTNTLRDICYRGTRRTPHIVRPLIHV
jgi:hypothetical protein